MGDSRPRAAYGGKSGATGGGKPRAAGGAEAEFGGDETSTAEHEKRPHSRAWRLERVSPIQKGAPADKMVNILVQKLIYYLIFVILALNQMI